MSAPTTAAAVAERDESHRGDTGAPTAAEMRAQALNRRLHGVGTLDLLRAVVSEEFPGKIALISSFGAEAAVLLHMISSIDSSTPVIFLNTGKLFGETLRYRDQLIERLGLEDVRSAEPDPARIEALDGDGILWYANANLCCHIRKVEPMGRALDGFDAWITGRKGFQGAARQNLPLIEATDDGRIRVNPLAGWSKADLDGYFETYELPRHPLEADGFLSIGCMPCTDRVRPGEEIRAGRWRGRGKTECGIHLPLSKAPPERFKPFGID